MKPWFGFFVGIAAYLLFSIFWEAIYPKLGVEWNKTAVKIVFFVVVVGVSLPIYLKLTRRDKK